MKDTFKHKGLRRRLVQHLRERGVEDEAILQAIEKIPRHFLMDEVFEETAYQDKAFPIGEGQTISQPFTVVMQTSLLEVERGQKVLEIGTGSGYQAAILAELGARVYTMERHKKLYREAKTNLHKMGYPQVKTFFGDGYKGLPAFAPFDRIIVTAAAPEIPEALIQQLKPGGIIVIPVGNEQVQQMQRLIKTTTTQYRIEKHGNFMFVPMRSGKNW